MEAGGSPERGCRAIPPTEGLVERWPQHRQALGNALQGRQPPSEVRPRSKHPMRMSSKLRRLGGSSPRACSTGDAREGLLCAREAGAGGKRLAHMGGAGSHRAIQRRVCCSQVLRRLQPATAHCVLRDAHRSGDLGGATGGGGRGAQASLTSPCPPSNHTIPINLTLTFAAGRFGHASHVDWVEQDPPNFVHGCFCHIIALHFGPQHSPRR